MRGKEEQKQEKYYLEAGHNSNRSLCNIYKNIDLHCKKNYKNPEFDSTKPSWDNRKGKIILTQGEFGK